MTPVLARDQKVRITISGSKFSGAGLAGILARRNYTKHLVPAIYSASWICPTPSWSNMKIVEMTTSEICAAEFAEWTIFDADLGNDDFLGECMRLFNVWLFFAEESAPWDAWFSWKDINTPRDMMTAITDEFAPRTAFSNWNMSDTMTAMGPAFNWPSWRDTDTERDLVTANQMTKSDRRRFAEWMELVSSESSSSLSSLSSTCSLLAKSWRPFMCNCDEELEEGMHLFAAWSTEADAEDDEEVLVEPESHDNQLTVALVSTKDLLPVPSAGLMRALSCPDLLMESLAVLLFETRHFTVINPAFGPSVLNTGNWLNYGFLNAGPGLLALPAPALNAGSGLLALPAPALNSGSGLLALPAPPAWMLALEYDRETDAPRSAVSTVSLPSGWDAVSARVSSSSIFNLFSTSTTSASSLFPDPTGFPSLDSTVAPWETPSTISGSSFTSVTGSSFTSSASSLAYPAGVPSLRSPTASLYSTSASSLAADPTGESAVSIPSNFFVAPLTSSAPRVYQSAPFTTDESSFSEHECTTSCFDGTTSASSLLADPTEASASSSSLFPDPTSAHSCSSSCFKVAPSTASASSIFPDPRSAHSCSASCFDIPSSTASASSNSLCSNCGVRHTEEGEITTSASSNSASAPLCPDCGVRHHNVEADDESNASSSASSTSSSSSSTNPYVHVRFGNYTLVPSTSDSGCSSTSSGYESDESVDESQHGYVIIDPVEETVERAARSPSTCCFEANADAEEELVVVVQPVTTVAAATQTQAPDEEVCGLDKYLELFDEVHEMRRKLKETMGDADENAAPAAALEPEQTYNHEEAAIISRMAIAWDALLEDTSRLLKKAFEEKRRKIRFLM